MGISERKEREKMEMKQLIISAAMKMFLEEGYAKTSIRNIAESIEYSPGTIYLYYKDKDELLYEVQQQSYLALLTTLKKKATSKDPLKKLSQICRTYIEFGLANPEMYDLMFIIRAPMNVDEKVHKTNGGDSLDYLVDCLRQCMEKELVRFTDLQLAALQIWSMMHGMVSLNLRCRLKIMLSDEETIKAALMKAADEYVAMVICNRAAAE